MSLATSRIGAVLLAIAVAGGGGATAAAAPGAPPATEPASQITAGDYCPDEQERAFLRRINSYRASRGKPALKLSATLGAAAEHHSRQMARLNYFSHTMAGGMSWQRNARNHGYRFNTLMGENIAAGNSTARATFGQWRTSPDHNQNMLDARYEAIGIGRAYDANSRYGWYWTTDFGGVADGGPAC